MPSGIYRRKKYLIRKNKFRRNVEELKEFVKENDIKLLELLEYIRREKRKKIKKETLSNVKNNS